MEKIKVKAIEIERLEGKTCYCGKKQTFPGFDQARKWLRSYSHTFPEHGGYDKHHFKLTFEDGFEFEGRLDCKHYNCDCNDLDLQEHLKNYLLIYSGKWKPTWMEDKKWKAFMADNEKCGIMVESKEMLDKYEI